MYGTKVLFFLYKIDFANYYEINLLNVFHILSNSPWDDEKFNFRNQK